jgi:hypothetical protein
VRHHLSGVVLRAPTRSAATWAGSPCEINCTAGWSSAGRSWRWHYRSLAIRRLTDEQGAQTRVASARVCVRREVHSDASGQSRCAPAGRRSNLTCACAPSAIRASFVMMASVAELNDSFVQRLRRRRRADDLVRDSRLRGGASMMCAGKTSVRRGHTAAEVEAGDSAGSSGRIRQTCPEAIGSNV